MQIVNWCYLSPNRINHLLLEYQDLFKTSYCIFVPKAALYLKDRLEQLGLLMDQEVKDRILIVDVICDSGETLRKTFEQVKKKYGLQVHIETFALISKNDFPTYVAHRISEALFDVWFFGCGLDLITLNNYDFFREWPSIAWCTRYTAIEQANEHPITMCLKAIQRDDILDSCIVSMNGLLVYDFSLLTRRTREVIE